MKKISELGEEKVIKILIDSFELMPDMPLPFGDDVSLIRTKNNFVVVKTDMLVGKTDIPPKMTLKQASRKSIIMNISDFAAKGVKPHAMLVSLGLPNYLFEEDIKEIGRGLNEAIREYGAYIIGGDTNEAEDIVISCSLFGFCGKKIITRSGAEPGDLVAVTGSFGKTSCGLKILLEGLNVEKRIEDPLIESILMPKARLQEGIRLAKEDLLSSSIDSSDGLSWSLYELSKASEVGFSLFNIPISKEVFKFAEKFKINPLELALYGGEEYELIMTLKPYSWKKVKKIIENIGTEVSLIGEVTKKRKIKLKTDNKIFLIEKKGWEHFRTSR